MSCLRKFAHSLMLLSSVSIAAWSVGCTPEPEVDTTPPAPAPPASGEAGSPISDGADPVEP